MKLHKTALLLLIIIGLFSSSVFGAGDAAKGKALFNNPKAFGGSRSCSYCHPDGKGLETASQQKKWSTPAGMAGTLEEAINFCIVGANKGKAIDVKSAQMVDMVAYIKSLARTKK